jgi:tellurite methyltransferase
VKKSNVKRLVEFGCGNGRDTNFFLHADLDVFAIDASEEAVQKTCAVGTKTNKARCFVHDVSNELSSEVLSSDVRTTIYARSLLHALTVDQIICLFSKL